MLANESSSYLSLWKKRKATCIKNVTAGQRSEQARHNAHNVLQAPVSCSANA